jgi:hypothetical protein
MRKIGTSDEKVMAMLSEVVSERPDYVYESGMEDAEGDTVCLYVQDGAPSCVIGHVLSRLGVSLDTLARFDNGGGSGADEVVGKTLDGVSDDMASALREAQVSQDQGYDWTHSLGMATRYMDQFAK